jgi:predicted RNase H-like nuclease
LKLIGVDLAWGERNPDALAAITITGNSATWLPPFFTHGDLALLAAVDQIAGDAPAHLAVDGPIICPNPTGSRPVDKLTHKLFHRQHAGCHPANLALTPRPPRVGRLFADAGYALAWDPALPRLAYEVYPHPALVRFLHLDRILRYKRGPVASRRAEFTKLQTFVRDRSLTEGITLSPEVADLLARPWTKPTEDLTDAMVCALIAHHHWKHAGARTQILGDKETGFLVLPIENRESKIEN